MEQLRTKEATAKVGASAQEVTELGGATRDPEPVEAAPGGARLNAPSVGGSEPGSTAVTQATVEAAQAETFVCDAGRVDEESREVVEAPSDAGEVVAQPELQPAREGMQPQP
jgi:hypothetical protein